MTREVFIAIAVTLVMASAANAADEPSFAAAAAKSAEQFTSGKGGQYGIAFMKSAGKALYQSAQGCRDSGFQLGANHDVVFIVSASGRIKQTIHGQRSAYGDCVTSHLRMPASVAKPPSDSWPIQIRFLHGSLRKDEHPAFMVAADDAASGSARDGSTRERAIINDQPAATHMQWDTTISMSTFQVASPSIIASNLKSRHSASGAYSSSRGTVRKGHSGSISLSPSMSLDDHNTNRPNQSMQLTPSRSAFTF